MDSPNETASIVAALRELLTSESIQGTRGTKDAAQLVIVPTGRTIKSLKPLLDEYLPKPERRKGTATAFSLASFIALVTRFASSASAVFADPNEDTPSLTAVFDYNPQGPTDTDWLQHRAVYEPALSEEWEAWAEKDGEMMPQVEFAQFIEDRATNLCVPNLDDPKIKTYADLVQGVFATPSDLIQLSRGLEINVATRVKAVNRLQSGEISMLWDEVHADGTGAPIKVPNLFQIMIPVFYAGEWYRLAAKLRYRVSGGSVTWGYELVQPELAFTNAFEEMATKIASETTTPVFFGAPEK